MLKPTSMKASTTTISLADSAIDPDASDLDQYQKDRWIKPECWRDLVKFKTGERPTVFVIGAIEPDEMNRIQDECGSVEGIARNSEMQWRCFLGAIRDMQDFGEKADKVDRCGVDYVDPVWLKDRFSRGMRAVALEIGLVAWFWNTLTGDELKN